MIKLNELTKSNPNIKVEELERFAKIIANVQKDIPQKGIGEPLDITSITRLTSDSNAKAIATEMQKVINKVMSTQDKKSEDAFKKNRKLLWKIAIATIIGSGFTAFLASILANYINQ